MCVVIQKVARASVDVEDTAVGKITGPGLTVLLGVAQDDGYEQVAALARKIAELRILGGKCSAMEIDTSILVVSQFTLYGDTRKGRRSPWPRAIPSEQAEPPVNAFVEDLCVRSLHVETGAFDAVMGVSLVNSGPFIVLVGT